MREKMDIHTWFELTYSSYLVLPRSILQSMPMEWQYRFVALLDEAGDLCDKNGVEMPGSYTVRAKGDDGRFIQDPYCDYDRGRRDVFKESKNVL